VFSREDAKEQHCELRIVGRPIRFWKPYRSCELPVMMQSWIKN